MERRARVHLLSGRASAIARGRATRAGILLLLVLLGAGAAHAKVFLTQEEAVRLAFPGASVERKSFFLTAGQQAEIRRRAGVERLSGALVVAYVASRDGRLVGTAYFDTHVVRTQPETLMIAVAPDGTVSRLEVLSFVEPEEYLPRENWYRQFPGRVLDDDLAMRRGIRPVSGATLTARATTEAVRRILALHAVLFGRAEKVS